ncbi:hypothetical protein G9E11_09240 [Arthrobacter sp. IA7]|uniref:hypothetical protein n=1 Tax=Arthrobacter ipis TaxID=2716202 RepID=UPI001681C73E|nr:hypothetical protein [Arthrobacter ipis]MBD1542427.1 hypothetical protein [Arthrobacter ipis]
MPAWGTPRHGRTGTASARTGHSGQGGWNASDSTDKDGARVVELLHDDGTHLIVGIWDGPESLQIDSFSACFDFPEYEYGEKY